MHYQPLFIAHVVKVLLKSCIVVQNKSPQLQKWAWHTHIDHMHIDHL